MHPFQSALTGMRKERLKFSMPKLEVRQRIQQVEVLQDMGMMELFTDAVANLSGIADDAFISRIVHETFVLVIMNIMSIYNKYLKGY